MRIPQAQTQCEPARERPAVLHVGPEIVDGTVRIGGVALCVELERRGVPEDQNVVAGRTPVGRRSIRMGVPRVVEPHLDVMIPPARARLVPACRRLDALSALVLSCSPDRGHACDDTSKLIARGDVRRIAVALLVPIPEPVLRRHDRVVPDGLPFSFTRVNGNKSRFSRLVRHQPRRTEVRVPIQVLIEADDLAGSAHLVRHFGREKTLQVESGVRGAVRLERLQDDVVASARTARTEKPELVADEPAAKLAS